MSRARRLAAIMFTDLEGFTSQTHGDEPSGLSLLREQEKLVRPILETYGGRKVKSMGDGLLIEFRNALDAVNCAVEIQRRAHERNVAAPTPPLRIRMGVHVGDIERRGTDIVGDSVNIASRIEQLAEAGGVCFSAQVFDQVRNKVAFQIAKLGPRSLKGIREPVEVFRAVLPWAVDGSPARGPSPHRLAVLPLTNISPDLKDEYFADGLTEELISVLSQIRGLRVTSRTSVNQYRGTAKPIRQIGNELGVDSLLEGSVRKAGDQLRITVQLIDPQTDEHLWAQTFDRRLENVFAIQSEVAEKTASALRLKLPRSEQEAISTPPTSNLTAYGFYLQGLHAFHSSSSADWEKAIGFFEEAIRVDPGFSLAHSHLGNALIAVSGETRPFAKALPRAREVTLRALELTPESSEAHTARGNLAFQGEHDWKLAEEELRRALDLNPSSSAAHTWYGILLVTLQRYDEAKDQLRDAMQLDPGLDWIPLHLIRAHLQTGEIDAAISVARGCIDRFPRSTTGRSALAISYLLAGDLARAEREGNMAILIASENRYSDTQTSEARFWHAIVRTRLGHPDDAKNLLAEWEKSPKTQLFRTAYRAGLFAVLGDTDLALTLLEAAARDGHSDLWFDYQNPYLDPIRNTPRFASLLRALNLPDFHPMPRRVPATDPNAPDQ